MYNGKCYNKSKWWQSTMPQSKWIHMNWGNRQWNPKFSSSPEQLETWMFGRSATASVLASFLCFHSAQDRADSLPSAQKLWKKSRNLLEIIIVVLALKLRHSLSASDFSPSIANDCYCPFSSCPAPIPSIVQLPMSCFFAFLILILHSAKVCFIFSSPSP